MRKLIEKYINRETVLYLVFGGVTTLVNYIVYWLCLRLGINYLISNVIAWIFAVAVAFVTNKLFVFESRKFDSRVLLREIGLFAGARLVSLGLEEGFLALTVGVFGANELLMKLIASVFVVIINYVFSKLVIFKKEAD